MRRSRKWFLALLAGVLALALGGLALYGWLRNSPEAPPTYVGSQTCAACHADQAAKWKGSHHQLAMCEANPDTVRGNFDDQTFTHQGVTSRFFRDGDRFLVTTEGPAGKMETYPIKYTFGVEPLQQYLIAFPGGRLQALTIAWDTEKKRWFHLYPDEKVPPDDWLHWTRGGQNWNYMCADCHSTNVEKNYDAEADTYHTTYSEISVGCEACHGPGSTHVQLASSKSLLRDPRWERGRGFGLEPIKDARGEIDRCARCHARRGVLRSGFHAGQPFLDHYVPELLDGELYFADGQIREEVYEYGSFLQSKMYRMGVRCSDCHDPHTAKPRAASNDLCTRCHTPGKYDTPGHHHHADGSKGSLCVACHMPTRTYMVVHPRRDHSLRIPRPDLTVTLGTPNACNACHPDRSAEWARDQVISWYGPVRPDGPSFGPAFAAARAGRPEGEELLGELLSRTDVNPIIRASALSLLGRYPGAAVRGRLTLGLAHPEPLVRYGAIRGLDREPGRDLARLLPPLLEDPVRLVRAEAARALTSFPPDGWPEPQRQAFARAFREYEEAQRAASDQAEARHNLGIVYANRGELRRAEAEYRAALRIDAQFLPARFNLAMLLDRLGDKRGAEQALRDILARSPDMADAHYSLGLLLAEDERRLDEAAEELGRAARLAPERARVRYNYGLALQRLGKPREAEAELLAAHRREPTSTDYLYALAVLCLQQKQWSAARRWADELLRVEPHNPRWQQLHQELGSPR